MTKEEFAEALDRATRIVASWPEWKRNAIVRWLDGEPTAKEPRQLVDNFNGNNDCY